MGKMICIEIQYMKNLIDPQWLMFGFGGGTLEGQDVLRLG